MIENSRRLYIGYIAGIIYHPTLNMYYVVAQDGTIKYFSSENKVDTAIFIVYFGISDDTDEIQFVGKLSDFPIIDVQSGNEKAYEVYVSEEDKEHLNTINKAIIRFDKDSYYFYLSIPNFMVFDIDRAISTHYIRQDRLTDKEILLLDYLKKNKVKLSRPTHEEIISKAKEIDSYVDSLDIASIIDSYSITIESYQISKIGGDDRYYADYITHCDKTDAYLSDLLPIVNKNLYKESGYTTNLGESPETRSKWENDAGCGVRVTKENARIRYNKEDHKKILLASYIQSNDDSYYSRTNELELLKEKVNRIWQLYDSIWIDSHHLNYKKSIARHNEGIKKNIL